jgi:cation diffusion facilitator family transporter
MLPSPAGDNAMVRQAQGRQVTIVSVCVNATLTIMQLWVGFIAHSQSLIADAIHTLSDIVADIFVLVANFKSGEAADAEHPYGHGRVETAATLALGLLLAITGGGILISAAQRITELNSAPIIGMGALWAALLTLAAKEGLFRYMLRIAERLRSPMLVANAWHARADALSSLVVAMGIGAAVLGFPIADAIAAIIVGAMIVRVGLKFAWQAIQELIDTGLSDTEVAALRGSISQTPGVLDLHELRTRRMAHQVLIDAHVRVDAQISVSEGHRIAEQARLRVLAAHPEVLDVLVHVDAEDDIEPTAVSEVIPERGILIAHLEKRLGTVFSPLDKITLHYLGGRVQAEVVLAPDTKLSFAEPIADGAIAIGRTQAKDIDPWFSSIQVSRRIDL